MIAICFLFALLAQAAPEGTKIRVACIGDSITAGARLRDPEHLGYPAQLAARLGDGYTVESYAEGGRTLLLDADLPSLRSESFARALAERPDVAIVVLGTNDTCGDESRPNWAHEGSLERDAATLVDRLRGASPDVRVLLCSPPPMFPEAPGLAPERVQDLREREPRLARIRAALRAVARERTGVEYHDLSRAFRADQVVDGVHPNSFGAEALADRLAPIVLATFAETSPVPDALRAAGFALEPSESFHEYAAFDLHFGAERVAGKLVVPEVVAQGAPWVWRARFFGHEPALDLSLLDRGFHLAYCDVADLYGAPLARDRFTRFHALLVAAGLDHRPVLEGMSRGGLIVFSWASEHPQDVAAVIGDNPVLDLRSWPGGHTGKRSDADWERCKAAWGLSEAQALDFRDGPLAHLAPLAEFRVPVMLVIGTADTVVPPAENADLVEERLVESGGLVEVWRKPGMDHHPHGLAPVDPLLRRVLAATGRAAPPTVRAVPSAEDRGGPAGWGGGTWFDQLEKLRALATAHPDLDVVFFGDSITQGLSGAEDRCAHEGGPRSFDRWFGARRAVSLGLSGDRTEHLLYRIDHGALPLLEPSWIVLQIGINDLVAARHTAIETAQGVLAVIDRLCTCEPRARILVCGPFPAGKSPDDPVRASIERVHREVAARADGQRVIHLDLRPLFLDAEGRPNERMAADALHVSAAGQEAWLEAVADFLDR